MKKNDFIKKLNEALPEDFNLSQKNLNEIFDIMFDTILDVVEDEGKFAVPGFGTFKMKERAARTGRNPQTGAELKIAASKSLGFKQANKVKERLN